MTNPLAAADFFALEAGECLDRLESLVGRPDGPPADEFLRTARVLRGSALMAGQQPHRARGRRARGARPGLPRRAATVGPGHPRAGRRRRSRSSACWCAGCGEWGDADTARTRPARAEPRVARRPHAGGRAGAGETSTATSTPACAPSWPGRARSSRARSTGPPAPSAPRPATGSRSTPSSAACSRSAAWPSWASWCRCPRSSTASSSPWAT